MDEVDLDAEAGGRAQDRAGVLRDVGLEKRERRARLLRDGHGLAAPAPILRPMPLKPHPVFSLFERLVDPLAEAPVERPPERVLDFYLHYLSPVKGVVALTALGSLLAAFAD